MLRNNNITIYIGEKNVHIDFSENSLKRVCEE